MLRHAMDLGGMEAVDRSKEERRVVPRFKPAVVVEFRRDGDLGPVLSTIKANRHVEIAAAVGAGKSTRLPQLIAQSTGKLVIHTIPFHLSAHRLADYLKTTPQGEHIVYVDDVESDLPSHGVAIMTNAHLEERYAKYGCAPIKGCLLYLDEIHESDCATAFEREAAPAMDYQSVIKATATTGPGTVLKPHLPGNRIEMTYPKCAVSSWSALDNGFPWSGSSIQGNTLINVDREATRVKLAMEYRNLGFDVRVHTSSCEQKAAYNEYLETERKLKDSNGGIVIVLVDYAFRSSLTIPGLKRIIDSCEVAVPSVKDGAPEVKYRAAYDFEVQQFAARGARLPGEVVEVYRSSEPPAKYMCDLEVLEADAANLLYRIHGFRPPLRLQGFSFFEGDVPADIAAALRGRHPARLCPMESRVPWVNGHVALKEEEKKAEFKYSAPGRKGKTVSCHTVYDKFQPVSPPPPVPTKHAITEVDVDDLDAYVSSRESMSDRVFTVDSSDSDDNLSIFQNKTNVVFPKPKRISKRVQAERAAAEAVERERLIAEEKLSCVSEGIDSPVGAAILNVPDFPVAVSRAAKDEVALMNEAPNSAGLRRFGSVVHGIRDLHDGISKRSKRKGKMKSLDDDELGSYIHYYDMDKAKTSEYFLRGLESILIFADGDSVHHAKGLPKEERLYAMRVLVDAFNGSTAIALGIQRLFYEISKRKHEDFVELVDETKMISTLQWMTDEMASAQAKVRLYRDAMLPFQDYDISIISPAIELEQRVMLEMMKKFDEAAVKKDPDKLQHYVNVLNKRPVKFTREGIGYPRRRGIEY